MKLHALLTISLVTLIGGCAARERQVDAELAQTQLIGLSRSELLACAGKPMTQTGSDTAEYFIYVRHEGGNGLAPEPVGSASSAAPISSTSVPLRCAATVKLEQGRVSSISYQGHTGGTIFNRQQVCGYIFERCVKR